MYENEIRAARQERDRLVRIREQHRQEMNAIKRSGARLRLWLCPLIAMLFSLLAWYQFVGAHNIAMGWLYIAGGMAFLLMLALGAMFDRPQ